MIELYRHYSSSGELLYVGISLSSVHRLSQHKESKHFSQISMIKIERYQTKIEALRVEKQAIVSEKPKYNILCRKSEGRTLWKTKRYEAIINPCLYCNIMPFHWVFHVEPYTYEDDLGHPQGNTVCEDYWVVSCSNLDCRERPTTGAYAPFDGSPVWFWNNKKFITDPLAYEEIMDNLNSRNYNEEFREKRR